jgi:glycosyltransferase involved in cell wall biosynthesis
MNFSGRKKLLIILNRLVVGGIATDVISTAYYLQNEFDILILYGMPARGEAEALFLKEKYPHLQLKQLKYFKRSVHPLNDWFACKEIYKEVLHFSPHVIHTHAAKAGLLGRLAGHKAKVPCIVHTFHGHLFHSYFHPLLSKALVYMERYLSRISSAIIAISHKQWEDLALRYKIANPSQIKLLPLGIDTNMSAHLPASKISFREKYHIPATTVCIGIIARITPIKNFPLFAEVVRLILQKPLSVAVQFVVIGDGNYKKQVQHILTQKQITWSEQAASSLQGTVLFTSWVQNVYAALEGLDIVILTSHNEGTALSLAEAQLYGKPIVATNVGGVCDIVKDAETGFLIPPNNAKLFAEKLFLLIENENLRKAMGKKAATFAKQNFSKEKEVLALANLYNNCK